ncbi:hypothetical protein CCR85_05430 [Rhodothalassium salexigens]|uniref:ThiF family adenylyltransferase n=1 Tax=Rhodothalassium salexigens TaxID=1086 RepID=UPI001913666F|nr:ThiF family adenylyltransferase [Rhodothalassium salexigens]MBK5910934.1 hypothetical protein [Rhodothalassium salexigens]
MKTDAQAHRSAGPGETEATPPAARPFDYDTAFARTLGWVSPAELAMLRRRKVAIAGLGGVGGSHALTLARLGIGRFALADFDRFDLANMNRQAGAFMSTMGQPKLDVIARMVRDINPEAEIDTFDAGVTAATMDAFLADADLYVDGLDFFVLDERAALFAKAAEAHIPAITAAPLGSGTAYLTFMPGSMTFEDYFRFEGESEARRRVKFMVGLAPKALHSRSLVDPSRINLRDRQGPSTPMGCQMASAVVGAEALKILTGRGEVRPAPAYHQFDPFTGRFVSGALPSGNAHPWRRLKIALAARWAQKMAETRRPDTGDVAPDAPLVHRILDLTRWAPSGDNEQPWRFEIVDDRTVRIHVRIVPGENIYEYARGRPIVLAAGGLLRTLEIAASGFNRSVSWTIDSRDPLVLTARLGADGSAEPDDLLPFVTTRSVDRRPYRAVPLTHRQRSRLTRCAEAAGFAVKWYESPTERWAMARLNARSTYVRLGLPEAHPTHQRVLKFDGPYVQTGLPVATTGLDPATQRLMRWAMARWDRSRLLNRTLGGAWTASIQLDLIPGLQCAGHFSIQWPDPASDRPLEDWLKAGRVLQDFWLVGEAEGLVMQPAYAPIIFSSHAADPDHRWQDPKMARAADALLAHTRRLHGLASDVSPGDAVVFTGRIGRAKAPSTSRSLRKPLSDLLTA